MNRTTGPPASPVRGMEEIEPMAFAGPIGEIELAAGLGAIGRRIPLPARDMDRVVRHARPVVVLGLEIDPSAAIARSLRRGDSGP